MVHVYDELYRVAKFSSIFGRFCWSTVEVVKRSLARRGIYLVHKGFGRMVCLVNAFLRINVVTVKVYVYLFW